MGEFDAAGAKFRHMLDLDPESARANVMLGLICLHRAEADEAISYLERALTLDSEYPGLRGAPRRRPFA